MAMTARVKDELSRLPVSKPCCRKAELAATLRFAGGLHLIGRQVVVEAELDTANAARRLRKDIADVFGHASELAVVHPGGLRKGNRYLVRVHTDGEQLARQTGLVDASGRDTFLGNRLKLKTRSARHQSAAIFSHFSGVTRREGEEAGNITVGVPLSWSQATTLTLDANNNIIIGEAISAPAGGLTLSAGGSIMTPTSYGRSDGSTGGCSPATESTGTTSTTRPSPTCAGNCFPSVRTTTCWRPRSPTRRGSPKSPPAVRH